MLAGKKSSGLEVKWTLYDLLGYLVQDALYRLHTLLTHGNVQNNPRYIGYIGLSGIIYCVDLC